MDVRLFHIHAAQEKTCSKKERRNGIAFTTEAGQIVRLRKELDQQEQVISTTIFQRSKILPEDHVKVFQWQYFLSVSVFVEWGRLPIIGNKSQPPPRLFQRLNKKPPEIISSEFSCLTSCSPV
jgi:hypothetical protein